MLSLTRQERQVILFLLTVALTGIGVDFLVKKYSPFKTVACFSQELGKIDLNSADKDLLMSLPGIGKKLAERIIEYRNKQPGFSQIEELKNVKGINDYRYEKIKDSLVVRQ